MKHILTALQRLRKNKYSNVAHLDEIERYVETGEPAELDKIQPGGRESFYELVNVLPRREDWTDHDRRLLGVVVKYNLANPRGYFDSIMHRLQHEDLPAEGDGSDAVLDYRDAYLAAGATSGQFEFQLLTQEVSLLRGDGRPNSAGRFLLDLGDSTLAARITAMSAKDNSTPVAMLLAAHRPKLLKRLAPRLLNFAASRYADGEERTSAEVLLEHDPSYAKLVHAAAEKSMYLNPKVRLGRRLFQTDPGTYRVYYENAARTYVRDEEPSTYEMSSANVVAWLFEDLGDDALPIAELAVTARPLDADFSGKILSALARYGPKGAAVLRTYLDVSADALLRPGRTPRPRWGHWPVHRDRAVAIAGLIEHDADDERLADDLKLGISQADPDEVVKYLKLGGKLKSGRELLWPMLKHKSKTVWRTAARSLGERPSPEDTERAIALLTERRADTRGAAVTLLGATGSDEAVAALEAHLDAEQIDDVRDLALQMLDEVWKKQGKTLTKTNVLTRIDKAETAGKLAAQPADWIDASALPAVTWKDGTLLSDREVRYLLYRQSRAKGMAVDVEARPMFDLIEDGRDFAAAVLDGFLVSKQDSKHRWAMTIAGRLGDDRVVVPLTKQIDAWCKGSRGKLSEYAVRALAMIGSDAALTAVDELSRKYASKQRNVGRAAIEAFADAADAKGVSVEELGDRVVPWLGFEEGPRRLDLDGVNFEIRVGPDLKLRYLNLDKNKTVKTLPKVADVELKQEMKTTAAVLREVGKAQISRLENLMVGQRRWPVDTWAELFLKHPILRVLATRIVWASYNGETPSTLFRPLEDGTLTDVEDEAVTLPTSGAIGIVHALDLEERTRRDWQEHFADYEVEPAFAQLDRAIESLATADCGSRELDAFADTELNAMTFRNRAEKLGWRRGSVGDGGGISCYVKAFPVAGVDCFIDLDHFYIGIGVDESVTLGSARFAKHGSYDTGSYAYDEPVGDDKRVVPLADVPALAYSEAVGSLRIISGKTGDTSNE